MQAAIDQNGVKSLLGTDSADGNGTVAVLANPSSRRLLVSDGSTGSDFGPEDAPRDENSTTALMGVSSADGVTPVVIYADPLTGRLLIDSN